MEIKALFKLAVILSLGIPAVGFAAAKAKSEMKEGVQTYSPNNGNVCLLSGAPPADLQYVVLARIVATKRTYGSIDELFPAMVREARMIGADAIINLQASQRFKGPLPWRITSPTGDGQAIKVLPDSPAIDCLKMGGRVWGPDNLEKTYEVDRTAPKAAESAPNNVPKPANGVEAIVKAPEEQAPPGDLYKELLKLDDLRKRGILSDAEFEQEKKKLLDRN